jgi:hypothetical protein
MSPSVGDFLQLTFSIALSLLFPPTTQTATQKMEKSWSTSTMSSRLTLPPVVFLLSVVPSAAMFQECSI